MSAPDWVKDAIFYQIFPDRFAPSPRLQKSPLLQPWESPPTPRGYKGGDLYGVIEHLHHIESLGFNALYLNPVFRAASNHRYNTHDYYQVDPMLGGNEALRELIDVCHRRGIKVLLDGVFNHVGRGFFQFQDILENGDRSPYVNWFHVHSFPIDAYGSDRAEGYAGWWNMASLPKLNTSNPMVREYLWNVATHWLAFGIDGWRLDVPNEIDDDEFWRVFRGRCRSVNPQCYLAGEIWGDPARWVRGDQFDGVMNYSLAKLILGLAGADSLDHDEIKRSGYHLIQPLTVENYAHHVERVFAGSSDRQAPVHLNLLGSHDTPRLLTMLGRDHSAVRLALMLQMTYPGAPCLYYGDEIGLEGGHDPDNRRAMPWNQLRVWNHALLTYTRKLIQLRQQHIALRHGTLRTLLARDGAYVFARELPEESLLVALNFNRHAVPMNLRYPSREKVKTPLHDLMGSLLLREKDGDLTCSAFPARSGAIFVVG